MKTFLKIINFSLLHFMVYIMLYVIREPNSLLHTMTKLVQIPKLNIAHHQAVFSVSMFNHDDISGMVIVKCAN